MTDRFSIFPCLSWPWHFWRGQVGYFVDVLKLRFVCCFLMIILRECIIEKNITTVMCPSQCFRSGKACCLTVFLVALSTTAWLRWCLPWFSLLSYYLFLCIAKCFGRDTFRSSKTPIFLKPSQILASLVDLACGKYYCGVLMVISVFLIHPSFSTWNYSLRNVISLPFI